LISLNLVQLKETANRKVFNLDLKELTVSEGLSRPAAFRDFVPDLWSRKTERCLSMFSSDLVHKVAAQMYLGPKSFSA